MTRGSSGEKRSWRNRTAGLVSALPLFVIGVSGIAWLPSLPSSVPTQWAGDTVVSTQPTVALFVVVASVALLAAIVCITAGFSTPDGSGVRHTFLVAGIFSGLAAIVWLLSCLAIQFPSSEVGSWGIVVVLGAAYGALPAAIAERAASLPFDAEATVHAVSSHDAASWTQTERSKPVAWSAALLLVLAILAWMAVAAVDHASLGILGAVVLSVAAAATLLMSRYRVSVDRRGLHIAIAGAIHLKRIPLKQISHAEAEHLDPLRWGGWGYRIMPGRSALIAHAGEGIVITLTNGKQFAVTVKDAPTGVALLGALNRTTSKDQ